MLYTKVNPRKPVHNNNNNNNKNGSRIQELYANFGILYKQKLVFSLESLIGSQRVIDNNVTWIFVGVVTIAVVVAVVDVVWHFGKTYRLNIVMLSSSSSSSLQLNPKKNFKLLALSTDFLFRPTPKPVRGALYNYYIYRFVLTYIFIQYV